MAKRQIALLRGINVGRHKRVGMPALRDVLAGAGYDGVATLLQSGNVVLSSGKSPATLERELSKVIEEGLGIETEVLVRTRDELAAVIDADPLAGVWDNGSRYHVSFLSAEPSRAVLDELAKLDAAPEQLSVGSRELYMWLPDGTQNATLPKLLSDTRLGVTATVRNWNTVTKLLALADS